VLIEVAYVSGPLQTLGYDLVDVVFSFNMHETIQEIERIKPEVVFNLVETLGGTGKLSCLPLMILDYLKVKYTGGHTDAVYQTSNKVLSKAIMGYQGIPTPAWQVLDTVSDKGLTLQPPFILKPIWEDASVGIDDESVIFDRERFYTKVSKIPEGEQGGYFIERYIEGRELNISLLAGNNKQQVLPTAEILFRGYPEGKPAIVGYDAKWKEDSFEFNNTPRTFSFKPQDARLLEETRAIAEKCWDIFNLCGYARVDFRVDRNNKPWVLEINSNPCISPDCGFIAATAEAGLTPVAVLQRIIDDAY
jgi:D-alanine-D-alanine ligase